MGRRIQPRAGSGRYVRATTQNVLGLTVYICEDCRRLNPAPVGTPKPETCHACGSERLTR